MHRIFFDKLFVKLGQVASTADVLKAMK
ncbi:hypothetical protein [Enterococcus gilvus]